MSKNNAQPLIEFKNVTLSFEQKSIFENFSLQIAATDKVVVFGKSGTGKSTLLKLILGFVQPDAGEIYVKNKPLSAQSINWIRTHIAYVDQDVIIGDGKVIDLIKEYFSFQANQNLKFNLQKIEKLMADFELNKNLLNQQIDQLSGGERQRIALVIALLLERPIMLLDEVTASLDPASKKIAIERLTQNKDLTLIVVTHDQEWKKLTHTKLFDFKEKEWKQ